MRIVKDAWADHLDALTRALSSLAQPVIDLAGDIWAALDAGGKLLVFGNGGSAADAQHFAAELTGHFAIEREPLAAVALSTDTSALTAISNDYEFGEVFARQVKALAKTGDVVVGISTSGRAENVLRGIDAANTRGARTWGLTGRDGGELAKVASRCLIVPSPHTARIQEIHILIIHTVCALIDARLEAPRQP